MQIVKESIKFGRDVLTAIYTSFLIMLFRCNTNTNTCILVTNGMGYGGAPLVLLEAAKVYKENGYRVIVYTEYYGDLIKVCRDNKIDVWIVPRGWKWLSELIFKCRFKFAFVNTAVMYNWVQKFEKRGIPTIWWLHEGDFYIDPIASKMPVQVASSTMVLTVSNRTVSALKKNKIYYNSRMLYYGINDLTEQYNETINRNNKTEFIFLVMGAICTRKNQIFAIQAYNQLPEQVKSNSKMVIVGEPLNKEDPYYIEFMNEVKKNHKIEYIPRVERKKIPLLYEQIDVLICCSLDDPLPVVVTECFMFGKTVIVSPGVGQYYMINDGYDGYFYSECDINSLSAKMKLAWINKENNTIKEHARELYVNNFTDSVFEKKLMAYTREMISR